jgi:hypothetical protein
MGKLGVILKFQSGFASFVGYGLKNNEIFNLTSTQNRDNCYYPYWYLKQLLADHGVELNTADINPINEIVFELHMDVQKNVGNIPAYVLLLETQQSNLTISARICSRTARYSHGMMI